MESEPVDAPGSHQEVAEVDVGALDAKQLLVLEALASGCGITEAAVASGVHRETVRRRLCQDAFRAILEDRRRRRREEALERLRGLVPLAITVLQEPLENRNVKAALALLRGIGPLARRASRAADVKPEANGCGCEPDVTF